jgi:hypothetical protein
MKIVLLSTETLHTNLSTRNVPALVKRSLALVFPCFWARLLACIEYEFSYELRCSSERRPFALQVTYNYDTAKHTSGISGCLMISGLALIRLRLELLFQTNFVVF